MKQILLFGYGAQEEAACAVIRQLGYGPKVLTEADMDQKIGYLFGLPGYRLRKPGEQKPVHPGPLMIFQDIPREALDEVLKALREAEITVRSVKAMLTPTNVEWTLRHLGEQVREEQAVMQVLLRIRKLRRQMPMPKPTDLQLVMALMKADQLLSGTQEVSLEEAEQTEKMLLSCQKAN